ncbi:DMT family transporter [Lentzea sp. NPDC059081]|uniref:DMT family transporter n=1 Tax=Lentzea sp. NPDC059081 TaxID=3346719 RepID=UPI0036C623C8
MFWLVLVLAGVMEAVWATALAASDGFRRPWPVVVFAVSVTLSGVGLAWAMRGIPVGTAYAVWVGVGAVLTVLVAVVRGGEKLNSSSGSGATISGLLGCICCLRLESLFLTASSRRKAA